MESGNELFCWPFDACAVLEPRPSRPLQQPVTALRLPTVPTVQRSMPFQLQPAIHPPLPVFDPSSPIHRFRIVQHSENLLRLPCHGAASPSLCDEAGPFHSGLAGGYSDRRIAASSIDSCQRHGRRNKTSGACPSNPLPLSSLSALFEVVSSHPVYYIPLSLPLFRPLILTLALRPKRLLF